MDAELFFANFAVFAVQKLFNRKDRQEHKEN
jgi:hypothetical protein